MSEVESNLEADVQIEITDDDAPVPNNTLPSKRVKTGQYYFK